MQPLALTWAVYFLLLACVSAFVLPRATRTGFRRALCGFRAANSSKDACDSVFEFRELGSVIEANLAKKGIVEPTPIQLEGWKVILQDDSSNVLLSAETAAGKTLAYTLPLLHLMTTEAGILKVASSPLSQKTLVVNPRTVIMLPNSLLVHQVHQVLSELVRDTGLRIDMVDNIETQEMPDVVIGTPQKLLSKFDVYNLNFKVDVFQNIAYLVLDEADQLVEQTSEACLRRFLALANKRVKTILAAATVSTAGRRSTKNCIDRLFKNLNVLSTDRVHALPTNIDPSFVYCTGYEQKVEKLLEILGEMKPQQRALVFCGTVKSSEALYDILKKTHRNLDVGLINRCVDVETQLAVVDEQHGNKVIICTDVLARGIDIPRVSTVVQFDFPTNVLDYIHRSGRAGRNMQRCKASLLWTDADRDFFTLLSDNRDNLPALFSRKRGLRKRLKRGVPVGDTLARSGGEDLHDKM